MKKKYFIVGLLALSTLTGCSDFLDQDNRSNVASAQFYATTTGFANLTNSAYSTLRSLYNTSPLLFVAGTELCYRDWETDRKSTRLNSSHITRSRMPSSA